MTDAPHVTANRDEIAVALDRYLDVPGYLNIYDLPAKVSRSFETTSEGIEAAVDYVLKRDATGTTGVYHRGTTLKQWLPSWQRGTDEDTEAWVSYQLDLDFGHDDYAPDADTVREVAATARLPEPTGWESSGHGLYPRWELAQSVPDSAEVRALAEDIHTEMARAFAVRSYKTDSTFDAARVWRISGTVNRKAQPVRATTVETRFSVYAWDELRAAVPRPEATEPTRDRVEPADRPFTLDAAAAFVREKAIEPLQAATKGERNNRLNDAGYLIGHFVEAGFWPKELAVQRLTELGREVGLDENEIGPTIRSGLTAGMADEPDSKGERFGRCVLVESDPFSATTDDATELAQLIHKMRLRRQAQEILDAESRPPRRPAATVSLAELLAEPDVEERWRIERLLPSGGKVLSHAPKKAGKTTLNGNLVRCLVDGDPFLASRAPDGFPGFKVTPLTSGRRVVVLDFEMTRQQLKDWLRDQDIQNQDAVHVEFLRGHPWDIRDDQIRAEWAERLGEVGADILLVDPIGPILHMLGIEENSNSEVGRFLANLDRLCVEAGVSEKFVSHHAGHNGERSRGASAFEGWPDAVWSLFRDGDTRFFAADGRDVSQPETELSHNSMSRHLALGRATTRATARATDDAEIIVDIVTESPGKTGNELKEMARHTAIGTKQQNAHDAIKAAIAARRIHTHNGSNRRQLHHPGESCPGCLRTDGDPGGPK